MKKTLIVIVLAIVAGCTNNQENAFIKAEKDSLKYSGLQNEFEVYKRHMLDSLHEDLAARLVKARADSIWMDNDLKNWKEELQWVKNREAQWRRYYLKLRGMSFRDTTIKN